MNETTYHPLFPFLRYLGTTWYFNLQSKADFAYFPDFDLLNNNQKALISWDSQYSKIEISKLDAAYQAWQKGLILHEPDKGLDIKLINPTISDNYRFINRYFHPLWSWYILLLRLLTLHNPIKEIRGFICSSHTKRVSLYDKVYPHTQILTNFDSKLLQNAPKVSVIIPTLNRYKWLKDALHDLEKQDYRNFDVIIVDQSEPVLETFYRQFDLKIKLIHQEEKALWLARNTAVKVSDAEYLLLYDDDSRTKPDWITQHIKCLDYFQADISSGISISVAGAKVPKNYSFFRWGDQLDTGNAMIKREVFRQIGLFDRQFEGQRMGDGEFGLRAYLAGFLNISNPLAGRIHLKVDKGGLRQMGSWDAFRPRSLFSPRPVPSVLYFVRKYFGKQEAIFMLLVGLAPSLVPYRFKGKKLIVLLSIPISFLLLPFLLIQVWRAYHISSLMMREGAKIEGIYSKKKLN